jgi:GMP synthase (glutamine-hydrolysing)
VRLLVVQHVIWERPGLIEQIAVDQGMVVDTLLMSAHGQRLNQGSIDRYDGVVIMGGPMGALDDDDYPSLAEERKLVRIAVERGTPVLGVCLGHQLIAVALGGELRTNATEEIGVGTVDVASNSSALGRGDRQLPVLNWHRDNITAPRGSTVLATSPTCPVQAFQLGSAIGVQFHLELTTSLMDDWLREPTMIADLPHDLTPARLRADFRKAKSELTTVGDRLISSFLSDVTSRKR